MILIATIVSMLLIGWVAWITVQKQEAGDKRFQDKLDADDERARKGREALRDELRRERQEKS